MNYFAGNIDVAVIGAGHAGIEAALAAARLGQKTVMFAINLDEKKYIKSYSSKFKTPGCILVETIPAESDPEKLGCYQYIKNKFVFDAEKWAAIEAARAETEAERRGKKQKRRTAQKAQRTAECGHAVGTA